MAHFNTIIPGYELNTFALGPEDTDTFIVKSREARSGSSICEVFDDLYHTIDSVSNHYLSKR